MPEEKKNIHVIWSNQIDLEDWKDFLKEEYPDLADEGKQLEVCHEMNGHYLGDEKLNLNIPLEGKLIALADIGLWNRRVGGYRMTVCRNISEIFEFTFCTDIDTYYYDSEDGEVKFKGVHHDGTNFYLFRELLDDDFSEEELDGFFDAVLSCNMTDDMLNKFTRSIGEQVAKVYGWPVVEKGV